MGLFSKKSKTTFRRHYLISRQREPTNPLFPRKTSFFGKIFRFKYPFLALLIIIGLGYFLFYSTFFQIQKIEISGTKNITPQEIENLAREVIEKNIFWVINQNNIFLLSKTRLEKNIRQGIENKFALDELKFTKKLPDNLKIEIKEKIPGLVWVTLDNDYYYVGLDGIIAGITNSEEYNPDFPVVFDKNSREVQVTDRVVSETLIQTLFQIKKDLPKVVNSDIDSFIIPEFDCGKKKVKKEISPEEPESRGVNQNLNSNQNINRNLNQNNNSNINTNQSLFPEELYEYEEIECDLVKLISELRVKIQEGPEIYFESQEDLNQQLQRLKVFLIQKNLQDCKYIDLRFKDRVYYQ